MNKKIRLGNGLIPFFGALKDDKEYEEIMKDLKNRWSYSQKKHFERIKELKLIRV